MAEHFADLIKAIRFVRQSLQTLYDAHPGDEQTVLLDLINERSELAGWEHWASLLREQLASDNAALSRVAGFGNGAALQHNSTVAVIK
jgi:hypothetical protein